MIHLRCSACDLEMSCSDLVHVYRNHVAVARVTGESWCPACWLWYQGADPDRIQELYDVDCRPCAGSAGVTALRDLLDEFNADCSPAMPFVSIITCRNGDAYQREMFNPRGARPAPVRPTIKLESGEARCFCNNCERLTVLGG